MEEIIKFKVHFREANVTISGEIYTPNYYDQIFSEIRKLSTAWSAEEIEKEIQRKINLTIVLTPTYDIETLSSLHLYRLRVLKEDEVGNEEDPTSFSYHPDPNKITENGRAHLVGQQVFYASADRHTPFVEMNDQIKEGESIGYLSTWNIMPTEPVNVRNLFLGISTEDEKSFASIMAKGTMEIFDTILKDLPENYRKNFVYGQRKYAELFRNKGKSLYHISSAIANFTFNGALAQGGDMPILTYPSVAKDEKAVNFAIRKDFVDNYLVLKEVLKVQIKKVGSKVVNTAILKRGYLVDGKVQWTVPHFKAECKTAFVSPDGKVETMKNITPKDVLLFSGDKRKYKVNDFFTGMEQNGFSLIDFAAERMNVPVDYSGPLQSDTLFPLNFTEQKLYLNSQSSEENRVNYLMLPVRFEFSYIPEIKQAG